MNVQGSVAQPPPAPNTYGHRSGSGLGMLTFGVTLFLVIWQICVLAVAGRVLDIVNGTKFFFFLNL